MVDVRWGEVDLAGRRPMSPNDPKADICLLGPVSRIVYAQVGNIGAGLAMRRRDFITLLGGMAAWPFAAQAQQKLIVIGFLGAGTAAKSSSMVGAIKQGLRENGLVEGKEYIFEQRWANGEYERFPAFARDLVEQKAAVIIVTTIAAARAAQRETSVIPIVMGMINDPVGSGLVTSLAQTRR